MSELIKDLEIPEITTDKEIEEKQKDGFLSAIIAAGFTPFLAGAIISALSDDEEVVRLLLADKQPLKFMTQQDSKVDDLICLPKQGEIYDKDDPRRPRIPFQLHPNCRCFWQDVLTGKNLGQF